MEYKPLPDYIALDKEKDEDIAILNCFEEQIRKKFAMKDLKLAVGHCGYIWENIVPSNLTLDSAVQEVINFFIRMEKLGRLLNELHRQNKTFPSENLYAQLNSKTRISEGSEIQIENSTQENQQTNLSKIQAKKLVRIINRKTVRILVDSNYTISFTSTDFGGDQIKPFTLPVSLKGYNLQEILAKVNQEQISQGYNSSLASEIGEALWNVFFRNNDFTIIIHLAYDMPPCRICIKTNDENVSHILALPWEYLKISSKLSGFLVDKFSIVREVNATGKLPDEPAFSLPLKFFAAIVQPHAIKEDRFDEKQAEICLLASHVPGKLEIAIFRATSLTSLADELEKKSLPYDGFIFIGHGESKDNTEGTLLFESSTNKNEIDRVNADRLMLALKKSQFSMVLINACESGVESIERGYTSVAARIVAQGIPWGIGWKYSVLFEDTLSFTKAFLQGLLEAEDLESAVGQGRENLVLSKPNDHPSWGSPSLFARHNWKKISDGT